MRVLVVQNIEGEDMGQLAEALAEAGAEVDLRRAYADDPLPDDASAHDAMVVLGGAQNALADSDFPYFAKLLDLLRLFEADDRAVLGICLGSQLVARAFGGDNQIGGATEFGWQGIALTDAAAADPVLGNLPRQFHAFQWHDDTFSLPPSALHLAGNETVANQAFRIGRATYGIQFHFEANSSVVRRWNKLFADDIAARHPDWPARYEAEEARHAAAADANGLALARAWVAAI